MRGAGDGLGTELFEFVRCIVSKFFCDVGIGVSCGLIISVPMDVLDHFHADTFLKEKDFCCMSEVVEADVGRLCLVVNSFQRWEGIWR